MLLLLKILAVLLGVGLADILLAKIFGRMYRDERRPDAVHFAVTDDGWTLALSEYDPPAGVARRRPVLCCHGLSGNHHGFDLTARTSLARFLAAAGHPTFVLDLRGAGWSDHGHVFGRHKLNWRLSDHYRHDAPAAIAKVLELTGADKLHWIGHSMGGMTAYAFLQTPLAAKISRLVILASPAVFEYMRPLLRWEFLLRPLLRVIPEAPIKTLSRSGAPLVESVEALQALGGNRFLPPGHAALSAANCQGQTPSSLLLDFARFVKAGRLVDDAGGDLLAGMKNIAVPALFLVGARDLTANDGAVESAYENWGAEKKWVMLGKKYGQQNDYDHMTLLLGGGVCEEVYPHIVDWLGRA